MRRMPPSSNGRYWQEGAARGAAAMAQIASCTTDASGNTVCFPSKASLHNWQVLAGGGGPALVPTPFNPRFHRHDER